jgi:hypothetical protein
MTKPIPQHAQITRVEDLIKPLMKAEEWEVNRYIYKRGHVTVLIGNRAFYVHGMGVIGPDGKTTVRKIFFPKKRRGPKKCDVCDGSGLKPNAPLPKDIGVPCLNCHGSGNETGKESRLFTKKRVPGIKWVIAMYDTFGEFGKNFDLSKAISYPQWLAGKKPK